MPQTYCPECGHYSRYKEGVKIVYCKKCGWGLEFKYTLKTIPGNPVTYEILHTALNNSIPIGGKQA
jgi:ribosomal protein L37AE/L43A